MATDTIRAASALAEAEAAEEQQLVILRVGDEAYGVDIAAVQEIIRMQKVTPVPGASMGGIEGILNLRGRIIPVMDLRKALGQMPTEHPDQCITVVEHQGTTLGLIVDGVSEVLRVKESEMEPPPDMVASAGAAYLSAIVKLEDRLITVLDLAALLTASGIL